MWNKLLVPLDGSPHSEIALSVAGCLAERAQAQLRLMHVLDFVAPAPIAPGLDAAWQGCAHSDAQCYLDSRAAQLQTSGIDVSTVVIEGEAAFVIPDAAHEWDASLIVMSTHGHGPMTRAWLGGVADSVVRSARIPILLLRPVLGDSATTPVGAFKHVLVLLDGSSLAERIVPHALTLARLCNAHVTLLQVVHPWVMPARPLAAAAHQPELRATVIAQRREGAQTYLTDIAVRLEGEMEQVTSAVIVAEAGDAAEILKYAEQQAADVIALATHGRAGLKRLVLGSVADKVMRGASVPVLVLRPGD
jgi:nucleotide-binding universal stress UspA family protein